MEGLRDVYLDHAGSIFLAAFAAVTAALLIAARHRLPERWWIGAGIAAAVMLALTTMIALALRGLDPNGTVPAEGWFAVGAAGILGFVAAVDVQLAWALITGRRPGSLAIGASALLGPATIVGGYLLLSRSVEWVRLS